MIYNHTNRNNNVLIAKSGSMSLTKDERFLKFQLFDGYSYLQEKEKRGKKRYPHRTTKFKEDLILFDLSGFDFKRTSAELYKGHYAMLNNQQLTNAIDSLKTKLSERTLQITENIEGKYNYTLDKNEKEIEGSVSDTSSIKSIRIYDYALNKLRALKSVTNTANSDLEYRSYIIRKHRIEWHRKIALAIACIILFLVGAPLGTIIKKGGFGMPVMACILFCVLSCNKYYWRESSKRGNAIRC